MARPQTSEHKMSREEAGRLGGKATSKKHDRSFYQTIGKKGGEATSETHNKEFYREIGRKGGSS
ncbi:MULTISPECIES: KGG domain-containing protein [unclassified Paenibacillus]|uniref:KGG domain-containing protein n=1 Tax=unclassified Paenibacillus TaxID=185978 RepID=UPI0009A76FFF|nr:MULTISPECIES: KGG domain-containing protein [unclassified Paenibacillus]SLK20705.1 hypothetical protein SAMN06272722_11692 [Paenibacillus sp. RU5A]SOC76252.1 hypothetical protein SAMN05880581_11692 [Paenibacillus sp. RU26A]SOC77897.1 hypothetical protein SAMN05880586_11692 [Paenibacillus sp. RU5M]